MYRFRMFSFSFFIFVSFAVVEAGGQDNTVVISGMDNSDEYVLITNTGSAPVNLRGWELHDHDWGKGEVFSITFGDLTLNPGDVLQLQSGKIGTVADENRKLPSATHFLRWADRNVWNNDGDTAYLHDSTGKLISEKTQKGRS